MANWTTVEASAADLYGSTLSANQQVKAKLIAKMGWQKVKHTDISDKLESPGALSLQEVELLIEIQGDLNTYLMAQYDTTKLPANQITAGTDANTDILLINHVASGFKTQVPGVVRSIEDRYTPTWQKEQVYARMDPIATYQHTIRTMSIAFEVDTNGGTDLVALRGISDAIKFLYPVYSKTQIGQSKSLSLAASPLLKMTLNDAEGNGIGYLQGTYVIVDTFEVARLDSAEDQHSPSALRAPLGDMANAIVPAHTLLTFGLTVLHQDQPGFDAVRTEGGFNISFHGRAGTTNMANANYPYGFGSNAMPGAAAAPTNPDFWETPEESPAGGTNVGTQVLDAQGAPVLAPGKGK